MILNYFKMDWIFLVNQCWSFLNPQRWLSRFHDIKVLKKLHCFILAECKSKKNALSLCFIQRNWITLRRDRHPNVNHFGRKVQSQTNDDDFEYFLYFSILCIIRSKKLSNLHWSLFQVSSFQGQEIPLQFNQSHFQTLEALRIKMIYNMSLYSQFELFYLISNLGCHKFQNELNFQQTI